MKGVKVSLTGNDKWIQVTSEFNNTKDDFMTALRKNSSEALYVQLVEALIQLIADQYAPGDKILSEREICETYGVSRTTVRQALTELLNMGYIYKRHGLGTFVADRQSHRENLAESYSFTEGMKKIGKEPSTQILDFALEPANYLLGRQLGLLPDEKVYRIDRLRLADGDPMMVERSYLPARVFPGLTADLLEKKPLYEVFRQNYGQEISVANEEITAALMTKLEAEVLGTSPHNPCLKIERLSYNLADEIIEFTISTARADQFSYHLSFQGQ